MATSDKLLARYRASRRTFEAIPGLSRYSGGELADHSENGDET